MPLLIRARWYWVSLITVLLAGSLWSGVAVAHPMGNFSINHYSAIQVEPSKVKVLYIIDMAEIPTFQELHGNSIPPLPDDTHTQEYVTRTAATLQKGLSLSIDSSPVILREVSHGVIFPQALVVFRP